jgi:hypothetical protein
MHGEVSGKAAMQFCFHMVALDFSDPTVKGRAAALHHLLYWRMEKRTWKP